MTYEWDSERFKTFDDVQDAIARALVDDLCNRHLGAVLETDEAGYRRTLHVEIRAQLVAAPTHTRDEECDLDDGHTCRTCGVWHGDPCPACGGRGFHRPDCAEDPDAPAEIAETRC